MKVARVVLALALAVLMLQGILLTASAQGPAGTWVSGIQIQNQSDTNVANITITFYWATGQAQSGVAYTFSDSIPAKQSKTYYVPSAFPDLPANFVGSAVVSSDQPVAAILNTTNTGAGTEADPKRIGAAAGVLSPATKVYAPYLRKNYWGRNSYVAVQNTSASDAQVTITYKSNTGADIPAATQTASVPAYSTHIFYQNANANLPNDFSGSGVITSAAPLAVVVNNANDNQGFKRSGFESYNGMSTGATKLYLPKLTVNYYGFQSSFTVQNIGDAPATMTAQYTFGGQTFSKTSPSIQPGAAWSVYLATTAASGLPQDFVGTGSAVITSDQPVVGLVTEVQGDRGYSVISSAAPEGTGTSVLLFPKFDRNYYKYNGGIQIQNIGNQATQVVATFSQTGRADVTTAAVTLQPGQSTFWYGPNVSGLTDNFSGSVVVTSLGGQPIAGIYTSKNDDPAKKGDYYTAYNGIQK